MQTPKHSQSRVSYAIHHGPVEISPIRRYKELVQQKVAVNTDMLEDFYFSTPSVIPDELYWSDLERLKILQRMKSQNKYQGITHDYWENWEFPKVYWNRRIRAIDHIFPHDMSWLKDEANILDIWCWQWLACVDLEKQFPWSHVLWITTEYSHNQKEEWVHLGIWEYLPHSFKEKFDFIISNRCFEYFLYPHYGLICSLLSMRKNGRILIDYFGESSMVWCNFLWLEWNFEKLSSEQKVLYEDHRLSHAAWIKRLKITLRVLEKQWKITLRVLEKQWKITLIDYSESSWHLYLQVNDNLALNDFF